MGTGLEDWRGWKKGFDKKGTPFLMKGVPFCFPPVSRLIISELLRSPTPSGPNPPAFAGQEGVGRIVSVRDGERYPPDYLIPWAFSKPIRRSASARICSSHASSPMVSRYKSVNASAQSALLSSMYLECRLSRNATGSRLITPLWLIEITSCRSPGPLLAPHPAARSLSITRGSAASSMSGNGPMPGYIVLKCLCPGRSDVSPRSTPGFRFWSHRDYPRARIARRRQKTPRDRK